MKPTHLIGDMAYGAAELLDWMVNHKGIKPHVPLWDKTQRTDETLSSSEFRWDEHANEYRCPADQPLRSQWRAFKRSRTHVTKADTIIYRSSQSDCAKCPIKARCCPNTPSPFGRPRERRGKFLLTVRGDTQVPRFNSNSDAFLAPRGILTRDPANQGSASG
jgi:hypothetical protein